MSYLEELLPKFRKGAKIRLAYWNKRKFVVLQNNVIVNNDNYEYPLSITETLSNQWEFYKELEPDWNYIIKNKCLCWFWDNNKSKKRIRILKSINKYETYKFSIVTPDNYVGDVSFVNCRPVRRDEVTFYEDKKDEI